jgi:hypothetical protein
MPSSALVLSRQHCAGILSVFDPYLTDDVAIDRQVAQRHLMVAVEITAAISSIAFDLPGAKSGQAGRRETDYLAAPAMNAATM